MRHSQVSGKFLCSELGEVIRRIVFKEMNLIRSLHLYTQSHRFKKMHFSKRIASLRISLKWNRDKSVAISNQISINSIYNRVYTITDNTGTVLREFILKKKTVAEINEARASW